MVSVTDSGGEEDTPKVVEIEEKRKASNFANSRIGQSIEKSHHIRKCLNMKSLIQFFAKLINPKQIKYGNFEPITIDVNSFNHVVAPPQQEIKN